MNLSYIWLQITYYIPTFLGASTFDDYLIFDKWQLAIQCSTGVIEACYRGLGIA